MAPKYEQLVMALRQTLPQWHADGQRKLPCEQELAAQFSVSRQTLRQAHAVFRCGRLHFILCSGCCSPKRASVSKILKISVSVKKLRRGPAGRRFLPAGKWVRNCRVSDAEG